MKNKLPSNHPNSLHYEIKVPRWVIKPTPPPPQSQKWFTPWIYLRYHTYHRHIYPAMIGACSEDAKPGSLVAIYGKEGEYQGIGLYNPYARVPVRRIGWAKEIPNESRFRKLIEDAVRFRLETLKIHEKSEAFRVVNSDGDGLSGLIIDKLGDLLSIEIHSLGIWQRIEQWIDLLHSLLATKRYRIDVDPLIAKIEGIEYFQPPITHPVRFKEHGIKYEIDFTKAHKTGFFCDQRENRRRFAELVKNQRVLDLCCYTGGFALAAKIIGNAREVTGVDLDENAILMARKNSNINQTHIRWVHTDAFVYLKQMKQNNELWDTIVLDPPKFIEDRSQIHQGNKKYEDLNSLAIEVLKPGGILVTCCCAGLISEAQFEEIIIKAAHRHNKRLQIFDRTGASPDHPISSDCLEGRYLKVLWARIW